MWPQLTAREVAKRNFCPGMSLFGLNLGNLLLYETAKETLMYRTVLWTLWERERVGRFGRMALKHVKYHV